MGITSESTSERAPQSRAPLGTAITPRARPTQGGIGRAQQFADEDRGTGGESLANFLGAFSLCLGLAEALAPGAIAKVIGIEDGDRRTKTLVRLMGIREISSGLAILAKQQPEKAVWS